jgi:O-antigen/teichoic acid export membrane protein
MITAQAELFVSNNNPQVVTLVVILALFTTIVANTLIHMENNREYKWWYGLLKIAFYFGSFALALTTGGWSAGIASISTYLGMEVNKLAQYLHLNGFIGRVLNGNGTRKQDKANKNTPSD